MVAKVNVIFVLAVCSVSFVLCLPKPRISTTSYSQTAEITDVASQEHKNIEESWKDTKVEEPVNTTVVAPVVIPGRVSCEYMEATEDAICQDHCIPKGYSHGICVSKTCSCI